MSEETTDLERVALIQHLDPDGVEGYLEAHEEVPRPVIEQMRESGVHRFLLFVEDTLSIGYIEVEDLDTFAEEYSANPECQEWEERVGQYKESGVDTDEASLPLMDRVWSLEDEPE